MALAAITAPDEANASSAAGASVWRTGFVVFALMMSVSAFYMLFQGGAADIANQKTSLPSNRDNLLYVGLWLTLYGLSGLIVLTAFRRRGIDYRLLAVAPFAAYVVASASWAQYPAASVLPATMLGLDIIIAAALAATMTPARFLRIMARLNVVLVGISFVMLVLTPASVISDPTRPGLLMAGQLFGAYGNKAALGTSACVSIIVIGFLPGVIEGRWMRILAMAMLAIGLILSNAAGAVAAGIVAVATLAAARLLPRFGAIIFAAAATLSLLWSLTLPFVDIGALGELLGRSSDLTGRGTFWPMAPGFILDQPFLGYGYLAFFNAGAYSRAWEIWQREIYFYTPEFHNSFLDILIGLGLIGAAAYLTVLALSAAIFLHPTLDRSCAEVLGAIIIVLTIGSATEFMFLAHNSFATIFLFYCFFVGGRRYARRPPGARPFGAGPLPQAG